MRNSRWRRILLTDWPQRMTALLTGLFLYQYVLWIQLEQVIWLKETVALVSGTLAVTGLAYFVPGLHKVWRGVIQLLLIIVWHGLYLNYHFVPVKIKSLETLWQFAVQNTSQIEPFIWFGLAAWLAYLAAMHFFQSRFRIFVLIVVSVLFFAVRDSFSVFYLWPQVAMVLFCGLSLLVIQHFNGLKHRAPVIWEAISEYPSSIGLPIVLIVAVTVFVGALAPSIDPLLTDPYTAWKKSRGEAVPLLGKGVSVTASTADASSGYSRDDSKLGGGFRYDYSPVMTVVASKRTYFRGETRALYNGSGWEMSDAEKKLPVSYVNAGNLRQDPRFNTSLLQTKEVTQDIVMEKEEAYPVLFGGFPIQKVAEINKGENPFHLLLWSPRQSELRFNGEGAYPKEYTIVSQQAILDEEGLRKVNVDYSQRADWSEYLQLPADLPARVKQLAADITKTGNNAYDKARLLEKYLNETYPYTNTPDESKGKSKDFTDRFLFEIKQGYCDYYSTAMAVLARSIGLPTRWVKGYTSGTAQMPDELRDFGAISQYMQNVDVDGAGTYTVRNSDAHSWVEIYFEGYGWISFEPTSGFRLPNVYPEAQPVPTATPAIDTTISETPVAESKASFPWVKLAVAGAILLVVLAAAAYLLVKKGVLKIGTSDERKQQAVNFNEKIVADFEKLQRFSRRKGYRRQEHETIREAILRWTAQSTWLKADLDALLHLFEQAKYSQAASTESDYLTAAQTIARIKEQMK